MPKTRYLETLIYALFAGVLFFLAWLILQKDLPAFPGGPFFAAQRTGIISLVFLGYAGLLLAGALVSFHHQRRGVSFTALAVAQLRAAFGMLREIGAFLAARCEERLELLLLLLVMLAGIGIRIFFLNQPMRMDEFYTFLYYLNQDSDPFYYVIPNNHVLHTLLAKLSVWLWGMGPVAIRLPAFLAGVLSIPAMFFVGKAFHRNAGLLAASGMAVLPYMVLYAGMARGYSLIVLLTLLLVLAGKYFLERPSTAGCIWISVISALGLLTMPTMLFVLAGFHLWLGLALFLRQRNVAGVFRELLIPCGLLTALLTVVFYTPTLISSNGAGAIFSNQFVDARSWADFSKQLLPHFRQILSDFSRDVPQLLEYGGLLLAGIGLFSALRRRDWAAALLLPAMLAGALLVFFARQAIPFVRTWIYWMPFALLFADLGYTDLIERLRPGLRRFPTLAIFTGALLFAGSLVSSDAITKYDDTGSFPEAAVVAQYLKPLMTGDEFLVVRDTANYPVFYYLCQAGAPPQKQDIDPATARRYFITQKGRHALSDLTGEPATPLFEYDDALIYTSTGGERPIYPGFIFDCRK